MAAIQERYQGLEKHSSGFKLLSAMGWKEGEGLVRDAAAPYILAGVSLVCTELTQLFYSYAQGSKKQGLKEHIKVKKKSNNAGIGVVSPLLCHLLTSSFSCLPLLVRPIFYFAFLPSAG